MSAPLVEGIDYYVDPEGLWVFTAHYLKNRGFCCHQGCRHCPYEPEATPRWRASPLCVHDGKLLVIELKEPESGLVLPFPPGGGIEAGETPAQAAEREGFEETGYRITVDPTSECSQRYQFRWGGQDFDVTTHFFRARLADPKATAEPRTAQEVDFLVSVQWIPLERAKKIFDHHPVMARAIYTLLASRR
jgi:8-oxo-dGTP pyrophosphatase MutT (NUDIX family)